MKILITSGSTREPIDAVRFLGNRSSGKMGVAIAAAAVSRGHDVSAVVGAASVSMPEGVAVQSVETTREMHDAVIKQWPAFDLLIMAAAVADFRPVATSSGKMRREGRLTLELEATEDILAAAGHLKSPRQRLIGFSLDEDSPGARQRAAGKIERKRLDLIVYNPLGTMDAEGISAELMWSDGKSRVVGSRSKREFADVLLEHAERLFEDQAASQRPGSSVARPDE